jgi:hypothetical protein
MSEIVFHIGGRIVSIEVSEAEARKILNDLVFQSSQSSSQLIENPKTAELIENADSDTSVIDISGSDFLSVPSREEITDYIKSQPEYKHSVESIAEHFAHKKVSSADGRAAELWLNSIRGAGNRVREDIMNDENGKWRSTRRARQKIFWFVRQNNSNIEDDEAETLKEIE